MTTRSESLVIRVMVCMLFGVFVAEIRQGSPWLACLVLALACQGANVLYKINSIRQAQRITAAEAFDQGFYEATATSGTPLGMTFLQNPYPRWTSAGRGWEDGRNFSWELDADRKGTWSWRVTANMTFEEEPLKADYPYMPPEKPIDFHGKHR